MLAYFRQAVFGMSDRCDGKERKALGDTYVGLEEFFTSASHPGSQTVATSYCCCTKYVYMYLLF